MANRTVNVTINYKVNTSDVQKAEENSKKAQKATDDLRKSTQNYGQAAKKSADEVSKALTDVNKTLGQLNTSFNSAADAVKTVFTATIVKEVAGAALELSKLGGQIDGVERAFRKLPNSTRLLEDLQSATKGTVKDLQLMQTAIKAQNFKIPLEQLGTLLQFAAVKAQQTGESVDYLVDSIVTGIGRESLLILDNLQLSATDIRKEMDQFGITMGEAVGRIANRELEKMGGLIETSVVQTDRLVSAWENFKGALGQAVNAGGPIASILNLITGLGAEKLDQLAKKIKETYDPLFETDKRVIAKFESDIEAALKIFKEKGKSEDLNFVIQNITEQINTQNQELQEQDKRIKDLIESGSIYAREATKKLKIERDATAAYIEQIKAIRQRVMLEVQSFQLSQKQAQEEERKKRQEELRERRRRADPFKLTPLNKNLLIDEFVEQVEKLIKDIEQHKALPKVRIPITPYIEMSEWDRIKEAFREQAELLKVTGIDIASDQLHSIVEREVDTYRVRLDNLQRFYDTQINLAGDNERAKQELEIRREKETSDLRRQIFEKERRARRSHVIIDTAASIAKTAATLGYPAALPFIAIAAAQGLSQLAIINREVPRFAKGVLSLKGPGTETSDSIPAFLSRGESVMTARETKKSLGILTAIRNNKLDDRMLSKIDFSGGRSVFNDERIVSAIQNQKFPKAPDIVRQAREVYEVYEEKRNFKKLVRSKSI